MEKRKENRKQMSLILGNHLKMLRSTRNMTQSYVAKHLNITQQALGLYENGKRMPSVEVVKRVSELFKVDLNTLLDIREQAVFETVDLLGDDAPVTLKNERKMIANSYDPKKVTTDEASDEKRLCITVDRVGNLKIDGVTITFEEFRQMLSNLKDEK